jgi:hypothetical protein
VRFVRRRGNGVGVGVEVDDGDMICDVLACWCAAGLSGSAMSQRYMNNGAIRRFVCINGCDGVLPRGMHHSEEIL